MTAETVVYDWNDDRIITSATEWRRTAKKPLLLTFDDGPSSQLIKMLDILKKHETKAIFFWQTRLIYERRPWARVLEDGHMIGAHSIHHPDLSRLSYSLQEKEIIGSVRKIESITGHRVSFFRPPFGSYNDDTLHILSKHKLKPLLWNVAGLDWEWKHEPQRIVTNVMEHVKEGSILLLHELIQTTAVLDKLITQLKKEGYEFILPE
ncbi:polysaccharide deacetylase family protein [Fictibacillus iocasae]|uniref:Polysaccharide deacetylase family protein n=1 Tax=Fictibacillus iocasae TaxID=2715437 RepID=A0ABW2NU46_9BACL